MSKDNKFYTVENGTFESSEKGKVHIFFQHYIPKKKLTKKIYHIVFQHGVIEHQHRHIVLFDYLMEKLNGQVIISAMDLAGHGKSGGHRAYISDFENFSKDWLSFLNICNGRFYSNEKVEIETIIISHSLGGLVVLNTLTNQEYELPFKLSKLVFTNPCISPSIDLPGSVKKAVVKFPIAANKLRLPLIYGAYDLTHDNGRAIAFIKDPLISKAITVKIGIEIMKACDKLVGHSYFFQYKSFFILSGQDKIVDNSKADIFISGMDKSLVELKKYPKMYHDILNETCRTEVFDEIIKYIKRK